MLIRSLAVHRDGVMRNNDVARVVAAGMMLIGVAAAADSGLNLSTQLVTQQVAVHVAAVPPVVAVRASGPALNANIVLGSQSRDCSVLVSRIALGVCAPIGPGDPVSPN